MNLTFEDKAKAKLDKQYKSSGFGSWEEYFIEASNYYNENVSEVHE